MFHYTPIHGVVTWRRPCTQPQKLNGITIAQRRHMGSAAGCIHEFQTKVPSWRRHMESAMHANLTNNMELQSRKRRHMESAAECIHVYLQNHTRRRHMESAMHANTKTKHGIAISQCRHMRSAADCTPSQLKHTYMASSHGVGDLPNCSKPLEQQQNNPVLKIERAPP